MLEERGQPRRGARKLVERIESLPDGELQRRQKTAEAALLNMGITFNVYGAEGGVERIFPFDVVPRIIHGNEWRQIEAGLKQRIEALNLFLRDIYSEQRILHEGVIPRHVIESSTTYRPACMGLRPPRDIWCHITGTDLIRDRDGEVYVLEDNLRCPSGVSYVLENRMILKRVMPKAFEWSKVRPIDDYPNRLLEALQWLSPPTHGVPNVVVLTPGIYNSAYFEHSYLAQQMGVELVEGRDLVVRDDRVYMRTTHGFEQVDVIYRRIDDDFMDPVAFRPDSALGVPGLMDVYRNGRVALANAPGTGVADDKVTYAYVPQMIKFYLGQDPIIRNVPTYVCWDDKDRQYVLEHLSELVVKTADGAGGYGMLVGPHSTREQCAEFARKIQDSPRSFIAQPTLALSRTPVLIDDHFEGRHVDLRPYIIYGRDIYVMPGGLTRVALRKGSLVVNSSQGGGSKDTWVVDD